MYRKNSYLVLSKTDDVTRTRTVQNTQKRCKNIVEVEGILYYILLVRHICNQYIIQNVGHNIFSMRG